MSVPSVASVVRWSKRLSARAASTVEMAALGSSVSEGPARGHADRAACRPVAVSSRGGRAGGPAMAARAGRQPAAAPAPALREQERPPRDQRPLVPLVVCHGWVSSAAWCWCVGLLRF